MLVPLKPFKFWATYLEILLAISIGFAIREVFESDSWLEKIGLMLISLFNLCSILWLWRRMSSDGEQWESYTKLGYIIDASLVITEINRLIDGTNEDPLDGLNFQNFPYNVFLLEAAHDLNGGFAKVAVKLAILGKLYVVIINQDTELERDIASAYLVIARRKVILKRETLMEEFLNGTGHISFSKGKDDLGIDNPLPINSVEVDELVTILHSLAPEHLVEDDYFDDEDDD